MLDVVAALAVTGERFMVCQRPEHKDRGFLWEFPGGKVEPGETGAQAIIRECREEMGIAVEPHGEFMQVIHEYAEVTIRLTVYIVRIVHGVPQRLEHRDIRFISAKEARDYAFCPADEAIVKAICTLATSGSLESLYA